MSLKLAEDRISKGDRNCARIIEAMQHIIQAEKLAKADYITIADAEALEEVKTIDRKVVIALAVWIGKTRLIDNIVI
jgi:pantoate--beta-alanine ligase